MGARSMSTEASLLLVGAWAAFWVGTHCIAARPGHGPHERRARRSQIFAAVASLAGLRLLTIVDVWPEDLTSGLGFAAEHQVFFAMAAGHWLVAVLEDWRCRDALSRSLDKRALGDVADPAMYLLRLHLSHHLVAAGCFVSLLMLRSCSGLGSFCLLSELPAILIHTRELALRRSPMPQWLRTREGVQRHWRRCYGLYSLGRGLPVVVYTYGVFAYRKELKRLAAEEAAALHGFSLLAIAYSFLYLDVLCAASRFDLQAASKEAMVQGGDAGAGTDSSSDEEAQPVAPVNPEASPLREVTLEALAAHAGAAPGSPVWVAIGGMAYDVTGFLSGCPCGEQVLRRWAGRDATEAFHDTAHSSVAQEQMLQYMVGPIRYPHTEYRIMEHDEEEKPVHGLLVAAAASFAAKFVVDSLLAGLAAKDTEAAMGRTELALLASLTAAGAGGLSVAVRLWRRPPPGRATPSAHVLAVGLLMWHFGFLGSCFSEPAGLAEAAPLPLELAGVLLLLLQEAVESSTAVVDKNVGFRGAAVAVLYSWWSRAEPVGLELDPHWGRVARLQRRVSNVLGVYAEPFVFASVLALSVALIVRQVAWCRRGAACGSSAVRGECLAVAAAGAVQLSGVYGAVSAVALACWDPTAVGRAAAVLLGRGHVWTAPLFVLSSASGLASLAALLAMASRCSPAFAARTAAFLGAAGGLVQCGLCGRSWLTLAGLIAHLAGLAARNRSRLREAGTYGRFSALPVHTVGAQAVWDRFRTWLGRSIWSVTVLQCREIINFWLPRELRVFAVDAPFPNLVAEYERTSYGVAAHFSSKKATSKQKVPQYCVCNVGQIHKGNLTDMQQTMNTLIDVWSEFQAPDMKGLLSNLVAVFPDVEEQMVAKEINLSFWESARDAHNWYVRSPGHRNALFQHTSGRLKTFGNLLASLELAAPLQCRDRCRQCGRPVQSKEAGGLAPSRCGVCGGAAFRHPVF